VARVDHLRTLVFGVVIAEAASSHRLHIDFTSTSVLGLLYIACLGERVYEDLFELRSKALIDAMLTGDERLASSDRLYLIQYVAGFDTCM